MLLFSSLVVVFRFTISIDSKKRKTKINYRKDTISVWSGLPNADFGPNGHREDAPNFRYSFLSAKIIYAQNYDFVYFFIDDKNKNK